MSTLALVWGITVFAGFCLGLIPCLGWLNWLNIPLALAGIVISIVAMARSRRPTPAAAIAGLVLSLAAAGLGLVRLVLGGGVL